MIRKYYPNNWREIKDAPDEYFPAMDFEDFRAWKVHGYELPANVFGIVRSESKHGGKTNEYTYKSEYQARNRVKKEVQKNRHVTLVTSEGVWHIQPYPIDFNNP